MTAIEHAIQFLSDTGHFPLADSKDEAKEIVAKLLKVKPIIDRKETNKVTGMQITQEEWDQIFEDEDDELDY